MCPLNYTASLSERQGPPNYAGSLGDMFSNSSSARIGYVYPDLDDRKHDILAGSPIKYCVPGIADHQGSANDTGSLAQTADWALVSGNAL